MLPSLRAARTPVVALAAAALAASVAVGITSPAGGFTPVVKPQATTMAVSSVHSLVVAANGRIYGAGKNDSGQLPGVPFDTTATTLTALDELPDGTTATSVAVGSLHSVALGANGKAYTVGFNNVGQLALGGPNPGSRETWGEVKGLPDGVTVRSIAASALNTYVVASDDKVYGAGFNESHQIDATATETVNSLKEIPMPAGNTPVKIAAGGPASGLDGFLVLLGSSGGVFGRGSNSDGQLTGVSTADKTAFTAFAGIVSGGAAVAAGGATSYIVTMDGTPVSTGRNDVGQLGADLGGSSTTLQLMEFSSAPAGTLATAISAGESHVVVAGSDGSAYAAGQAGAGAIGNGQTVSNRLTLTRMVPVADLTLGTIVEVAAGASTSLLRDADGLVLGAGAGLNGQLAGFTQNQASVVQATGQVVLNYVAPSISGTAQVGQTLTANDGSWSVTPDQAFDYQWFNGATAITGATASTYTLTGDDLGDAITVRVTGTRTGFGSATSAVSASVVPVAGAFSLLGAPSFSGRRSVGSVLTARAGGSSPAADSVTFEWLRDGAVLSTGPARRLVPADAGRRISVRATAVRAGFAGRSSTSVGSVVALHNLKRPTIKGTAKVGKTLRIRSKGSWTPSPSSYSYQWLRNGKVVKKATKTSYRLTSKDKGKRITVRVTARKPGVPSTSAISSRTGKVKK